LYLSITEEVKSGILCFRPHQEINKFNQHFEASDMMSVMRQGFPSPSRDQ